MRQQLYVASCDGCRNEIRNHDVVVLQRNLDANGWESKGNLDYCEKCVAVSKERTAQTLRSMELEPAEVDLKQVFVSDELGHSQSFMVPEKRITLQQAIDMYESFCSQAFKNVVFSWSYGGIPVKKIFKANSTDDVSITVVEGMKITFKRV